MFNSVTHRRRSARKASRQYVVSSHEAGKASSRPSNSSHMRNQDGVGLRRLPGPYAIGNPTARGLVASHDSITNPLICCPPRSKFGEECIHAAFLAIGVTLCGKYVPAEHGRQRQQRKIRAALPYALSQLSGNPFVRQSVCASLHRYQIQMLHSNLIVDSYRSARVMMDHACSQ